MSDDDVTLPQYVWEQVKFGFAIGIGGTFALVAVFTVVLAPLVLADWQWGARWALLIGLPWMFGCIVALSFGIVAAQEWHDVKDRIDD